MENYFFCVLIHLSVLHACRGSKINTPTPSHALASQTLVCSSVKLPTILTTKLYSMVNIINVVTTSHTLTTTKNVKNVWLRNKKKKCYKFLYKKTNRGGRPTTQSLFTRVKIVICARQSVCS